MHKKIPHTQISGLKPAPGFGVIHKPFGHLEVGRGFCKSTLLFSEMVHKLKGGQKCLKEVPGVYGWPLTGWALITHFELWLRKSLEKMKMSICQNFLNEYEKYKSMIYYQDCCRCLSITYATGLFCKNAKLYFWNWMF